MKIVAVVGSGSGCGKTTVVCSILRAFPGLGAVKISPREGAACVEWGPGPDGKDTNRYTESGAARVARIVGPRETVREVWEQMEERFADCAAVVVEGTRSLDLQGEKLIVFVDGEERGSARKERSDEHARKADIVVRGFSGDATPEGGARDDRRASFEAALIDALRGFLSRPGSGTPT